jgi:hypothetical protein
VSGWLSEVPVIESMVLSYYIVCGYGALLNEAALELLPRFLCYFRTASFGN